tara:strand:- start:489 stop:1355 length:867 start_codon:yes stop_codon:yes gene_type:complete
MKILKKVIFPVAGLGTRFLPATKAIPKEMLPIVDKPIIQYAVEEAIKAGITDMIFVIGRTKNAIIDHFDSSPDLENELTRANKKNLLKLLKDVSSPNINYYFVRQKSPKGVGDAISCAERIIGNEAFGVIFPDDLIDSKKPCLKQMIDILPSTNSSIIAIESVNKRDIDKYGIINFSNKHDSLYEISSIDEKPSIAKAKTNLAVVGRFILTPNIFKLLSKTKPGHGNEIQLTDAIHALLSTDNVYGYQFSGQRYDCGSKLGYLKATVNYALKHEELSSDFKKYLKNNK